MNGEPFQRFSMAKDYEKPLQTAQGSFSSSLITRLKPRVNEIAPRGPRLWTGRVFKRHNEVFQGPSDNCYLSWRGKFSLSGRVQSNTPPHRHGPLNSMIGPSDVIIPVAKPR